jgi:hypothetical protein
MELNEVQNRILDQSIISKQDLELYFDKSMRWVRDSIFTDGILHKIGIRPSLWSKIKNFDLDQSKRIKEYLLSYK